MNTSYLGEERVYYLYVAQALSEDWQDTFAQLSITPYQGGTRIRIRCQDQAELYGVIRLLFQLGLTLQGLRQEGYLFTKDDE